MPLVSIVIPTWNRLPLLQRAVASVLSQTCGDAELIVVDDESGDGTAEWLASLPPRARFVRRRTRSPGEARNIGAQLASGEYLAFLDSDDVWMPWALATFAQAIDRCGRPGVIGASFRQFVDERELSAEHDGELVADVYPDYLSSWATQAVVGAGMMVVRRDAFERAGGFVSEPVNLEDHDLMLRLGTVPGFVHVRSPLVLGWRRHAGSVTRDLARSVAGCAMLIARERSGGYPGGDDRAPARRNIITTHARSVSLECAKAGLARQAAGIYLDTLPWHAASGRWKYIVSFPLVMGAACLRPRSA